MIANEDKTLLVVFSSPLGGGKAFASKLLLKKFLICHIKSKSPNENKVQENEMERIIMVCLRKILNELKGKVSFRFSLECSS